MDTAQFLADLRAQRDRLNTAITALEALNGTAVSPAKPATKPAAPIATKRIVSPEARLRMAEAQQKRWAKKKRAVKAAAKKAAAPVATSAVKEAPKKTEPKKAKGGITAAGRKKMSEAAKARWAAKKAAAAKTA